LVNQLKTTYPLPISLMHQTQTTTLLSLCSCNKKILPGKEITCKNSKSSIYHTQNPITACFFIQIPHVSLNVTAIM